MVWISTGLGLVALLLAVYVFSKVTEMRVENAEVKSEQKRLEKMFDAAANEVATRAWDRVRRRSEAKEKENGPATEEQPTQGRNLTGPEVYRRWKGLP